ncbi:MAG: tandem-95 repeat protein [Candidatus Thiodiazotropha sp. (ex. Lucinoma kazani)]
MSRRRSKKKSHSLICEELEPRILLSADLAGVAVDLTSNDVGHQVDESDLQIIEAALQSDPQVQAVESDISTRELVIIDPATPDYQSLVDDLISQNGNGIEQIDDILNAYQDLDAVHILSHGSDGGVQLGDAYLNLHSLSANAGTIESWHDAFSEEGDLLIYGCDLAASEDGQSLVEALARLTGADVAASEDLTGHEGLGGDWDLEHAEGVIETDVAISEKGQRNWTGTLATDIDFINADDPAHHWKLDGDAVDSVGSADGAITDATTVTGQDGDALRFDESGDYVTIPDVTMNNDFTVTFQFKVDDNTGSLFQYIYSHGDINTTNSLNIFINEASHGTDPNVLRTVIRDADDTLDNLALEFDISSIIGDGEWHTYTLTVEAGVGSTVYLDGVVKNTDTRGGGSFNPSGNVYLGARYDLDVDRMFGGDLDDVKIYDHVHPPTGVGTGLSAGTVIATDPVGGTVTYSLVDDAGGMFSVDSDSGELFWTGAPVTSTAQSYDITVRVTDSGAPAYDEVMTIKTGTGDSDTITGTTNDDLIYGLGESGSSLGTTNYIVNGSFESGGSPSSVGWTDVNGAGFDIETSGNHGVTATDGSYYLDMKALDFSIIEQAVAGLTNGTTYQLSLDAGLTGVGDGLLHVYWNGVLLDTIDPTSNTLQTYSYNVVAGSGDGTNTVRFDEDGPNTAQTTALDNVRMYEVLPGSGGDTLDGGTGDDILIGDGVGGNGSTSQSLTINDAGFEDIALPDGGTTSLSAAWSDVFNNNEVFIGDPTTFEFSTGAPAEGENALLIPEDNQVSQTLASNFDSSKDYELSLKLGNPLSSGNGNTYSIQLWAGGTLIGSASGAEPTADTWTDINISADGAAYVAADGTALRIVLTNTTPYSGSLDYFAVDDIQLNEITTSVVAAGDDTLTGGAGDDYLDGGAGTDTAVFTGNRADYNITWYAGTSELVVTDTRSGSPDGTDTIVNVEKMQFSDQTITITDPSAQFNDPPAITSNGGGATANINVAENTTAVTTVTSTDPDPDTLTYSISGGDDAAKFNINSSTGDLTFISAPDFENPTDVGTNNVYDVQVQVDDGNGGTDTQDIAVTVTNGSENEAPTFNLAGTPTFTPHTITTSANSARSVTTVDVDGDGDMDVLSASNTDDRIAWYENDGNGNFTTHTITATADQAHSVAAADVDGDGDIDVLSASVGDDKIAWYENDGNENFTAHTITTAADGAFSVTTADVDGDGDVDVLSAAINGHEITWYENDGAENFTAHLITNAILSPNSVTTADVDGDGDMDVLSSSVDDDRIIWYENDGAENFTAHTITAAANGASSVTTADVDGDGDLDVLSASIYDDKIAWYENDGLENFTAHTISTAADLASSVAVADMDHDGDLDVLSASYSDDKIAWYENDGAENFTAHTISTSADFAYSVTTADVDGDGDLDVLSASSFDNKIAWYESNAVTLDGNPTFTENGAAVVLDADVNVSDAELDALNGGNGDYDGASLTLVRNGGANTEDVFSFNDGNGITLSGGDLIKNSQIIATFDTTTTAGELVITFTNANGETPTSTDVDNILRQITYANSSEAPPASAQIDWTFDDGNTGAQGGGGALQALGSTTVTITSVNDDPIVANLDGDTLNYTEGDGAVLLEQGGDAVVSDPDSSDFAGGDLIVEIDGGGVPAEDVLSVRNQGTGAGQIGLSGSDVTYEGVVIGTLSGGSSGSPLTVTFNASATPTAVTALVNNITYENSNVDNPTAGVRSVTVDITDGNGGASLSQNLTVNVSAVNDQAIADLNGSDAGGIDFATTFTEGLGAVNITDTDATLSDPDHTTYQDLGINLDGGFVDGSDEKVTIAGYTFSYGVFDNVIRTVGGTNFEIDFDGSGFNIAEELGGVMPEADLQSLLRGITYENASENPTAGDRTIDITPQDAGGLLGLTATSTITVAAVNDDPTNAGSLPTDISVTEDVWSNLDLSAMGLSDVDAGGGSLTVTLTSSTGGNLFVAAGTGITVGGTSNATTFTGNLTDLNNYFNSTSSIAYLHGTPGTNGDNADTISVTVNDNGNTGSGGGTDINLGTVNVDIGTVNNAPDFGDGDADGIVTTPIGSGDDDGTSVTVQADGKILVAGYSHNGSNNDFALTRYNADGSLDTSFGGGDGIVTTAVGSNNDNAFSVAVQTDGKILVGGYSRIGGNYDFALTRYNADGTLDTSFGGGDGIVTTGVGTLDAYANDITVQTDGKILVAGESYNGSDIDFTLIRYNTNGTLDTGFGGGDGIVTTDVGSGFDQGRSVTVQADGKILVGGYADIGIAKDFALTRYNTDGTLDTSFGGGDGIVTTTVGPAADYGQSVTVQADGKILVAGDTYNGSNYDFAVTRYNTDGTLDTSFGGDGIVTTDLGAGHDFGFGVTTQTDGKILVAGYGDIGPNKDFALVRYNSDGTLDTSFDAIGLLDGAPSFTEGGAAVVLDSDVDVMDAELDALNGGNGDYDGASLTLVRNGGANTEDVFSFNDGNGITLSGGDLIKNSQIIATFDTTTTAGELVITFTNANGETPTSTDVDNILRQITYANSSEAPPASAQIDWTFDDGNTGAQGGGGALQALGSTTVTITSVNDDPIVANLDGDTLNYTEGDGAVLLEQGGDAVVSDPDSSDFAGGDIEVEIDGGGVPAEDVLSVRNQGTGAGQIGLSGSDVTYEGVVIGTLSGGSSGSPLTVTFNASATPTAVTALVNNITYENSNVDNPTAGVRSVTVDITDGNGGASLSQNLTVNVSAVNDQAIADLNGSDAGGIDFATTFTEGLGAVNITDTDATLSDPDHTTYQDLGINLDGGFVDGSDEKVTIAGYTFSYGVFDNVIRTVGGTNFEIDFDGSGFNIAEELGGVMPEADLQSLLRGITYENTSQDPTAGDRSINIFAQDSSLLIGPVATTTITVNPLNDSPVATDNTNTVSENSFVSGNAITDDSGSGIDSDPEGDVLQVSQVEGAAYTPGLPVILASGAQVTFQTNGFYTYNTSGQFDGLGAGNSVIDNFSYQVSDGNGGFDTASVTVTVNGVNDEQSLDTNTGLTLNEGATATIINTMLSTSDVDNTAGELIYTVTSAPTTGQLELTTDLGVPINSFNQDDINNNRLVYVHDGNENFSDSFDFSVDDGAGVASTDTFIITISPVSDATPVAVADTITVAEGGTATTLVGGATDVLNNDTGLGDTPVTVSLVTGPTQSAAFTLNADGTFSYTHNGSENFTDSFTYRVTDNDGQTSDATVNITVTPVSDATPVAVVDTITVAEGATITTLVGGSNTVLNNDTGLGDTPVTVSLVTGPTESAAFTLNADGTFSYTHNGSENFSDSFTYRVTDNDGQTSDATVNITITPVSDATPVAVADTITVAEGGTATTLVGGATDVLSNDTGLGDTPVTVSLVTGPTQSASFTLNADGTFSYTHNGTENFTDSFTYRVTDNDGQTADATVSINVTPVSDATPVAVADTISVAEGGTATTLVGGATDVLSNDTGLGDTPVTVSLVTGPTQSASFTLNADGTFSYTHNGSENFTDSFTYRVTDNDGQTSDATVTINVTPVSDATPVANTDTITVAEGGTATTLVGGATDVLNNDTGLGDTPVTVSLVTGPTQSAAFTLNADGTFSYTHNGSENFTDSFTYRVTDNDGQTADATVNITITPVSDQTPEAVADTITVAEGGTATTLVGGATDVLSNDTGLGDTPVTVSLVTGPTESAAFTLNADGTFSYTHNGSENFTDSFTYRVTDNDGQTSDATVNITITPVSDATPVAVADTITVAEGGTATTLVGGATDVLNNDTGLGDTPVTVSLVTGPTESAAFTLNADGTFSYTHNGSENFTDSFTYRVTDNDGQTSDATVTINVTPVSDQTPVAVADTISVAEGGTATTLVGGATDVLSNDTGLGDTPVTVSLVTGPTQSSAFTLNADGTFSYNHNGSENYIDSFTYRVTDNDGQSSDATVLINVTANNHPPVASDVSINVVEDTVYTGFLPIASDGDGDDVTYQLESNSAHGSVLVNGEGSFSYAPDTDYNGTDSFTYNISDGNGGINSYTVVIDVGAVNDSPVITSHSENGNVMLAIEENTSSVTTVTADDPDNDTVSFAIDEGTDLGLFNIDSESGELIFINPPDAENPLDSDQDNVYQVQILVTDGNGGADRQSFTIEVTDVDEFDVGLVMDMLDDPDVVHLSSEADNAVGIVAYAEDLDATNSRITYTLDENANGLFVIDPSSGVVRLTSITDPHDISQFDITVRATSDDGSYSLKSFNIAINRVVDEIPVPEVPHLDEIIFDLGPMEPQDLPVGDVSIEGQEEIEPTVVDATFESIGESEEVLQPAREDQIVAIIETERHVIERFSTALFGSESRNNFQFKYHQARLTPVPVAPNELPTFNTMSSDLLEVPATIWKLLDSMNQEMSDHQGQQVANDGLVFQTATFSTLALSAGYVAWLLRAGVLSASLLSFTPLWRQIDPLPVLSAHARQRDDEQDKISDDDPDEERLAKLFDRKKKHEKQTSFRQK